MTYVSVALRRQVVDRAGNCCEYCKVNQEDRYLPYEIDHIIAEKHVIAEKHGRPTTAENLCWSCHICNSLKGSDISSVDWDGTGATSHRCSTLVNICGMTTFGWRAPRLCH